MKLFNIRHPERVKVYKNYYNAITRKASPGKIKYLKILLDNTPLNLCPKCNQSYRNHCRPNGECPII